MESPKLSALLVLAMLAISSSPFALAWEKAEPECHSCESGSPPSTGIPLPPISIPSVPLPSVPLPPVSIPSVPLPSVPLPPVSVPSVPLPSVPLPPVSIPSVPIPKLPVPPVTLPPIPIIGGSPPKKGHRKACPPPPSPPTPTPSPTPSSDKCPIDALKLGACVDVLGNEVHIGDANVKCCPLVKGIAGLSAAACLCTAIKAKVLDISVYVPIALEVLINCGCDVPPGYKCT